jgi:hypothetical protein
MSIRDSIVARVMEAGGRLTVRSALNPILWLCLIITVPSLVIARVGEETPSWIIAIACCPVAAAILGFLFLLLFDRDKLQSEDYQIRKRSLELIEQKGDARAVLASSFEAIANPENPEQLSDSSKDER